MGDQISGTTVRVQRWLDRLSQGDPAARERLLEHAGRRLKALASCMFSDFQRLNRLFDADDVLQQSKLRLWRALEVIRPQTPEHFFRLAALQIRRELREMARRPEVTRPIDQPLSFEMFPASPVTPIREPFDTAHVADKLAFWIDFHEAVEKLPELERTVVDLYLYHGRPQQEISQFLNVSVRQVKVYWRSARRRLARLLAVHFPKRHGPTANGS